MCFVAPAAHYAATWPDPVERLRGLAALNRINALACIRSARHGWLGACYSACEVLTTAYFGLGWRNVVLSKGHAAALQYACLFGLGLLEPDQLLSYKDGPKGLQAHTDRRTPGVLVNTGSLGQALSKVAALAFLSRRDERFAVVLGDGELQEGQNYEAFQTIVHHDLRNLVVIVDDNGLQTALPTDSIKRIASRRRVLEGFGFDVDEGDGHDPAWLLTALSETPRRPRALLARTRKAGGSDALAAAGPLARWHAEVPDDELADRVVAEQVERAAIPALRDAWLEHVARRPARQAPVARVDEKAGSTGQHFARRLAALAVADERIVVLDGDLAGPCGVSGLAATLPPGRFVELGIAEQDLVSFAGGLALEGRIPVVNTYASFYKRAIEQIAVNQSERCGRGVGKVIYAGHYAGLGYYTDGSTHQSLNDVGLMRSLPGLVVVDPVDGRQTAALLDWAVADAPGSVYVRLRRIGVGLDDDPRLIDAAARAAAADPWGAALGPLVVDRGPGVDRCLIAAGPIATRLALDALGTPGLDRWGLAILSVYGGVPLNVERWLAILGGVDRVLTLEDGGPQGGLYSLVCDLVQAPSLGRVRVQPVFAAGPGWSCRTFEACCRHNFFDVERVRALALDEGAW